MDFGWAIFPPEPATLEWVAAVRDMALNDAQNLDLLRHGGTWFAGVGALPNDPDGRLGDGPAFQCAARALAEDVTRPLPLHPAQVSVVHPGYPGRDPGETDAAHRYRRTRDAAHLDGLLPEGPDRRRHLREPHAYILGVALTSADRQAAPLVVYEQSHIVMRRAFLKALAGTDPRDWGEVDLTETYHATRRRCFEVCLRVEISLKPGATVLLHRLSLHGTAPWSEGATADPEGRAIAYFRPQLQDMRDWLHLP
ncbi:MAG: hypothetical protein AAF376_02390 [Pseudomonadota bacterium]